MKKPTLNKEIYKQSSLNYLRTLFNDLKLHKIEFIKNYSPFITDDLSLGQCYGYKEMKNKLEKEENYCYQEFARILKESEEGITK